MALRGGWGKNARYLKRQRFYFWSFAVAREGRGKGKRRFAPKGVWRSSSHAEDVEPMVMLPEGVQRPPIPQPQEKMLGRPKRKDEYHLAEVFQTDCWRTVK